MTAIERWRKGLTIAIGFMLTLALSNYFFPPGPVDRYWNYFAIGLAILIGYLSGSRDERKANRIHLTS